MIASVVVPIRRLVTRILIHVIGLPAADLPAGKSTEMQRKCF
jgi:hypothetical protein